MAAHLGLHKTPEFMASMYSGRWRHEDHPGRATWFPAGNVPANKGMRRPGWHAGRMRQTQFKKGHKPATWVPVGTEVVDCEGYRKRKVSDDRTKASRFNWRFVHVLAWEEANGPVPPGHAVAFRNGNQADIRIENLELISRAELMRRNTLHNLPKPLADVIRLRGRLVRRIRERQEASA